MGEIILYNLPGFLVGIVVGAFIMRQMASKWIGAMYESREELLKRLAAEFGEETIERIVGKMVIDLLNEEK